MFVKIIQSAICSNVWEHSTYFHRGKYFSLLYQRLTVSFIYGDYLTPSKSSLVER